MNKSESIEAGLRKRFQTSESKLVKGKCYGYKAGANGELVINSEESEIVTLIFVQYQSDMSLGVIAAELSKQQIPSPTGKAHWSREAIHKLLSNENISRGCYSRKPMCKVYLVENNVRIWARSGICTRKLTLQSSVRGW